jgi:hypothetical protein
VTDLIYRSSITSTNSSIPRLLFITFVVVAVVLTIGASLFFIPSLFGPRWPWLLKPFNARFLGAVYFAEMVTVLITIRVRRWSPARLAVPQAVVFTAIVTLSSVLQYSQFNFSRPIVWGWFVIYILPMVIIAFYWWQYRNLGASDVVSLSKAWRDYLLAEAIVLGVYGISLFVLPSVAGAFWPWTINAFHAQMYSAIFLTGAVGAWILYKSAAHLELVAQGLTQVSFGGLSILGLLVVDGTVHTVAWYALGTWVWVGACALLAVSGLGLAWQGWRSSRQDDRGVHV